MIRARSAAIACVLGLVVAGCGPTAASVGAPEATPPPSPVPAISASAGVPSGSPSPASTSSPTEAVMSPSTPPFELTSSAFPEGGSIPRRYTCDGADGSPPLAWSGAPDGTKSLVLLVDDPDARGFVHWVAYDIAGSTMGSLPEGVSKSSTTPRQGTNGFGAVGYGGPCPPSGTHHYVFRLLALDAGLSLHGAPDARTVEAATRGHVLGEARLTGTYRRG